MTEWEVELAIENRTTRKYAGILLLNVNAHNEAGAIAIAIDRAMDMLTSRFAVTVNGAKNLG